MPDIETTIDLAAKTIVELAPGLKRFTAMVASPARRTRETAEYLRTAPAFSGLSLPQQIEIDSVFDERSLFSSSHRTLLGEKVTQLLQAADTFGSGFIIVTHEPIIHEIPNIKQPIKTDYLSINQIRTSMIG